MKLTLDKVKFTRRFFSIFLLALLSFGLLTCVPVSVEVSPQSQVDMWLRYQREAKGILDRARVFTGAPIVFLAVYDDYYENRSVIVTSASAGEGLAAGTESRDTNSSGYSDILEVHKEGQTFWSHTDNLPPGPLRESLIASEKTFIVAAPVFTKDNYLFGYVALSVGKGFTQPTSLLIESTIRAAEEITRLNGLLR
jgi:hypothetical protein